MWKYIEKAFKDILLIRIIIALWSTPFLVLTAWSVYEYNALITKPLLIIFPILMGALGFFLLYVGFFGKNSSVEKYSGQINEGGEILGVLFALAVLIAAIPIWEILKRIKVQNEKL